MDHRFISHTDSSVANKQDTIAVDTDVCSDFMSTLPLELIHIILEYVDLADLFHMELVCKSWKQRVSDDSVWERYTRPLQHKSCQTKPGQRKKHIFKTMCNRIANPEKHSLVKKLDTGERHVIKYDYHDGKLAIVSVIRNDEGIPEDLGIWLIAESYLEIFHVGEQIEKVFECEVDFHNSLRLVGSMVFVYPKIFINSDPDGLYTPVLIYCANSGGLIADIDSILVADVLEYDEQHDLLVTASPKRVGVYPKFREMLREDSLGQDPVVISSYSLASGNEPIPYLVKVVHPERPSIESKATEKEFYYIIVVGDSGLLVAVMDAQDHRVLKKNDLSHVPADVSGRPNMANFLPSSSECKLRIMMLLRIPFHIDGFQVTQLGHGVLIGQVNLPEAGTPIDQIKLDAESLIEGASFFESTYDPYFNVDGPEGWRNRWHTGSVFDAALIPCPLHLIDPNLTETHVEIFVSQDKEHDKSVEQLLDQRPATVFNLAPGRNWLIRIQPPEDAIDFKLPRTSWLDGFQTENETSVFLMYTCDGQLNLHMWK